MKKHINVTPAKILANRRNTQASTGPRTPDGKAASKLNALKHGLLAQNVVVCGTQFTESPEEFEKLCRQFYLRLSPVGPLEELLVDQIVQASRRLRRLGTSALPRDEPPRTAAAPAAGRTGQRSPGGGPIRQPRN